MKAGKFKVLVVGAGNIAHLFDTPNSSEITTHVKGYKSRSETFDVSHIFDIDLEKAKSAAQIWNIPFFTDKISELEVQKFDVISICTPDDTHNYYLDWALTLLPRVIFIEKPLGISEAKANLVFGIARKNNIEIIVNYSRTFIKELNELKNQFRNGDFGDIYAINLKYHKGFNHNASHLVNLLLFLVEVQSSESYVYQSINDYSNNDRSISAIVKAKIADKDVVLNVQAFHQSEVNILELDILAENSRIIFTESYGPRLFSYTMKSYFDGISLREYVFDRQTPILRGQAMTNAIGFIANILQDNIERKTLEDMVNLNIRTIKLIELIYK